MRMLLVTPQRNEFEYLLEAFRNEGCKTDSIPLGSLEGVKIHDFDITVATGGHGKAQFAAQTQYLLSHLPNVELVICAGASGRLVKHLSLGDLVVATSTIEHDYKLRFVEESLPVHKGDIQSIEQLKFIAQKLHFPFEIHFGRIASGDEDIVDRKRATALHEKTNALCVAWEGSGGARAAALSQVPFIEIRAITDGADASASEKFYENIEKTIPNIASFLIPWLREFNVG